MKFKNKFLLSGVIAMLFLALSFQFVFCSKPIETFAATSTVTVTNGDFNSSPSSYYLDTSPSGWSLLKDGVSATAGIINTNAEKFSSYTSAYQLSENPETSTDDNSDTKVLMINAKTSTNANGNTNQGFGSSKITLSAYSYYHLRVYTKAQVGAVGSVYLKGLDDTLKFESFSNTSWKAYNFYIATGSTSESITIELWLGNDVAQTSSYAVFFDNVSCTKLSESQYQSESSTNSYNQKYEIAKNYVTSFENADFETGTTQGWTAISAFPINTYHRIINTNNTSSMFDFEFLGGDNQNGSYALWLASKDAPTSSFGYQSSTIALKAFNVYKVNFNAKVEDGTTATVILKETDKVTEYDADYQPQSVSITVSSNDTSNTVQNNYKNYSFYISGHSRYDSEFYLQLMLGTEDSPNSGSVVFDNFTIEKVTNTELENASSSDAIATLKLNTAATSSSIANSTFNNGYFADDSYSYPAVANDWTSTNPNNQVVGIINTNTQRFNEIKNSIGGLANPGNHEGFSGTDNEYNNVLMLWNKTSSYQSISSSSYTVTNYDGKTYNYYKLSFYFKTLPSNSTSVNFGLQILDQNSDVIYQLKNINSTEWKKFEINIKNGYYTSSLTIKFLLGDEEVNAEGYVFLDNVKIQSQTLDAQGWTGLVQNQGNYSKTADFSNGLFNTSSNQNADGTYDLLGYTATLVSGQSNGTVATSGLVDTKSNIFDVICDSNNSNDKMLYISTFGECEYQLKSNFTAKLASGSKYKISLYVKTNFANVSEDYDKTYGLSISLSDTTGSFENIKTDGEWKEYYLIVNAEEDIESNYIFSVKVQNQTTGTIFIDNLTIEKLEDTDYDTIYSQNKDNSSYAFVGAAETTDDDEDEDTTDTDTEDSDFNWLILPSLITAVALIIALVGFILRRVNFKKSKKVATTYDRKKTLYLDITRKQAQDARDKEVQQLNIELQEIQKQIDELEQSHKQEVAEQRKDSNISKNQIEKSFKAYASKHEDLENKKEKLLNKIKYANTPDYLLEIQKKLNAQAKKQNKENKQIQK